jgi:Holliday junction resolvasome RuvABC endonuclease subunit
MLVCFDPGRHLGVARGPVGVIDRVVLRTHKLRDVTALGPYLSSATDFILREIDGATACAAEIPNTAGQNHTGIRKNFALVGHIAWLCAQRGVPFREVPVHEAKLALTGRGNAQKPDMIAGAAEKFRIPAHLLDEHMADAAGVWFVFSFGAPPSKTQLAKQAAAARREAKSKRALL